MNERAQPATWIARSRDETLFASLYHRHYRAIRDFCRRRVPKDVVDDVVAETFLTAWRRIDDIPRGDQALLWLYGVAYRTALKARQTATRRLHSAQQAPRATPEAQQPSGEAASRELLRLLEEEVQRLADKYRTPFVLCCLEGSRPILVEVQALVSTSSYGMARRMAVGLDQHRLTLLLAVLEKRAGLHLVSDDVFVNIAGGMTIEEPAADLAIVAAVASSLRNRPVPGGTAVFGEVGLGGEIRGVPQAALRIREAEQMGFTRIVLPSANVDTGPEPADRDQDHAELVGVRSVGEALDVLLS